MSQALRIGVAGLGTVGVSTLELLEAQSELIAQRCGRPILVSAVSARDRRKDRGIDLSAVRWFDDAVALAADPEISSTLVQLNRSQTILGNLHLNEQQALEKLLTALEQAVSNGDRP